MWEVNEYRLIVNKAIKRISEERSFWNLVNLIVHVVPVFPSKLQKTLIDRMWKFFEKKCQ